MRKLIIFILITGVLLLSVFASGLSSRKTITATGIDVSTYQNDINWDLTKDYVDFVVARCGEGRTLVDDQWKNNADACRRLEIPFGTYLVSHMDSEERALDEANHALKQVEGYTLTLPIYVDIEPFLAEKVNPDSLRRYITVFCEAIEAAGYRAGVYANAYTWDNFLNHPDYDRWERWIAQYNHTVNYKYHYSMWQRSDSGSIPGIKGPVDLDNWYGAPFTNECSHTYTFTDTPGASCTDAGVRKFTCTKCGNSYEEVLSAGSHSYSESIVQDKTCTQDGLRRFTCTKCGYGYDEPITATGHSFTQTVVPSDGVHGSYILYTCACGYSYTSEEQPVCTNHVADHGVLTRIPSETGSGEKTFSCTNCGAFMYTEYVPSAGEHRQSCPSVSFTDAPSYTNWAHEGIDACLSDGLFKGVGGNCFDPNGSMTRAMLVTVLWRYEGCPQASQPSGFIDVPQGVWYADAIAWAQECGLVKGIGDGYFDPMGEITREQIATILFRGEMPAATRSIPADLLSDFADASLVSEYAREAMAWAVQRGYIVGSLDYGVLRLNPQGITTRAQAATIICRLPR